MFFMFLKCFQICLAAFDHAESGQVGVDCLAFERI